MRNILAIVLMTGALAIGMSTGQQKEQSEVDLQAAIRMETVEGNLKGAIEAYKKIAEGNNRGIAAKALIRMGQCYEKLGDAEARKAYERVVREFADQKEAVEQARALLAASSRNKQLESGIVAQQKWALPTGLWTVMRQPSLDGRYIPYTNFAQTRLYIHDFTTSEDRVVRESPTGEAFFGPPLISPDSKQIVYTRFTLGGGLYGGHDYELLVAGIDGSHPIVLISDKEKWIQPRAWSPDGKSILVTMASGAEAVSLMLLSVADHSLRVLTTPGDYSSMCFSPDGRYIVAYRVSPTTGILPGPLKLIPTDGSKEVLLLESKANNWPPFWTPDGRNILFLSDRSGTTDLWSLGVSDGRPEAEPRLVRSDVGPMELLGFTSDGSLYYKTSINAQGDIYVADLDPATGLVISKPERISQRFVGSAGFPADWSPEGQFLAYTRRAYLEYNRSRIISIIIRSEATGEEREVLPVPAAAFNQSFAFPNVLKWFPDGRSLLATDFTNNRKLIFRQIDVKTGQVTVLLDLSDSGKVVYAPNLSSDGKTLFYVESGADVYRLMRRNLENGDEKELFQMTSSSRSIDDLELSKDGRQLAFVLNDWEQKAESLMIIPAEGGSPRELYRSKTSITHINWTSDNRHVMMEYYPESGEKRVWSISIEGGEPQPSPFATGLSAVHPDGRRIAFCSIKGGNDEVWVLRNLLSQPKVSR
jgi:Tol biopolymer transport system component